MIGTFYFWDSCIANTPDGTPSIFESSIKDTCQRRKNTKGGKETSLEGGAHGFHYSKSKGKDNEQ